MPDSATEYVYVMPFCSLKEEVEAGDVRVVPVRRGEACPEELSDVLDGLLTPYKRLWGEGIPAANVISVRGKFRHAPKSQENNTLVAEMVDLVAFASLADREIFEPGGRYSNYSCFATFGVPIMRAGRLLSITIRRRATILDQGVDELTQTVPEQCENMHRLSLDRELLDALLRWRSRATPRDWSKWLNAIQCFDQANTDSELMRDQVEWGLLASAFETLLGAASRAEDVARRFARVLKPSTDLLFEVSPRGAGNAQTLETTRHAWMKEFYELRGSYSHGNLSDEPVIWTRDEHLALASWAFPLVARVLLKGYAGLPDDADWREEIEMFEKFAALPDPLEPVPDPRHSGDCHWNRMRYGRQR